MGNSRTAISSAAAARESIQIWMNHSSSTRGDYYVGAHGLGLLSSHGHPRTADRAGDSLHEEEKMKKREEEKEKKKKVSTVVLYVRLLKRQYNRKGSRFTERRMQHFRS